MTPRTILLAEDDRFLRRAAEVTLKQRGFTVLLAADGQEALDMARAHRPDLLLLDLLMPRKTGMEVLTELRAEPATRDLRVLILSNSSKELEMQSAKTLGVAGYWIKANLSLKELGDRVTALLNGRS
jgi:two-component system alkaline phosphatase synthesis response regulator PhoP